MTLPVKNFLICVLLSFYSLQAYPQVIPPENRIDWSQAGCSFFFTGFGARSEHTFVWRIK